MSVVSEISINAFKKGQPCNVCATESCPVEVFKSRRDEFLLGSDQHIENALRLMLSTRAVTGKLNITEGKKNIKLNKRQKSYTLMMETPCGAKIVVNTSQIG